MHRSSTGGGTRRLKRAIASVTTFALATTSALALSPSSASAAPGTEIPTEMRSQMQSALFGLREASMLPQLVGAIPGLGASPATLLGLHDVFADLAAAAAAAPTEEDLDEALTMLEGSLPSGFEFGPVSAIEDGGVTTVEFDLTLAGTRAAELALATDDAILVGSEQDITTSIATTTFTFEYDASIASPADAFSIVSPMPSMAVSLAAGISIPDTDPEDVVFGFASAEASGSADFDIGFAATLVDPDGDGRLTGTELAALDIVDLVDLDLAASGGADVAIALDLAADVFGTQFTASLTLDDESLFEGDIPEPQVAFGGTGENLELLTNFSGESAITALTQMVSGFGGAMIGGDVDLPFLKDGVFIPGDLAESDDFDRIFEAIEPLMSYVEPRAAGQIVCGTGQMPPEGGGGVEGIPYGQTLFVSTTDTVYCRAYTAEDGTNVQWDVGDGTAVSLTVAESVGVSPSKNISFTPGSDGPIDVSVTFDGETSGSVEVLPRPETIQELLLELLAADLIPESPTPGVPAFDFQPDTDSLEFDLDFTTPGFSRDVSVNAGSELVADTGLSGLQASGSVDADLLIGDIAAGVTFGLILTDDVADIEGASIAGLPDLEPGPGNRFYVKGADDLLSVETVQLAGNINLAGRLGFLDVTAVFAGTLERADDSVPAVSVGFGPNLGITVAGTADADATLVADLLRSGPTAFELATNLVLDADLAIDSSVGIQGLGATAAGSVGILWDLSDAEPTITPSLEFDTNLAPFDTALELTHDPAAPLADEALLEVAAPGGLLAESGLVGSTIDDGNGNTCTIVSVISNTTLRCENPMLVPGTDQIDINPIDFTDGVTYEVSGNTLAFLAEILAALEQLADYVETAIGTDAFEEPIPVIGVRPADLIDHVEQLRKMIDEFRGIQDGTVNCNLDVPAPGDGDAPVDVRAIDVDAYGAADLACSVSSSTGVATDGRFRIVDAETGAPDAPGGWTNATAGSVAATPTATTALSLGSLDDDGDGYITLGDEYTVEVEWTADGGPKSAALPPRVPQSIEQLEESVEQVLHLPADAVDFFLDLDQPEPTLGMTFAYGICSTTAPDTHTDECAGMPTGPTPSASLNMAMGSLPDFVGLDTDGVVAVQYAAVGRFSVGVPLSDPTDPGWGPVVYGDTGLDLAVFVDGEDLEMNASIGPANAHLGAGAALTGTADNDPDDGDLPETLVDDDVNLDGVPDDTEVTRSGDGESCLTTAATTDVLDCDIADGWTAGDQYVVGGDGVLQAGLSFSIDVLDGGSAFDADTAIPFGDVTFDVTDFEELTGGAGDCGDIVLSRFQVVDVLGMADGDNSLTGLACGLFSIELEIGSGEIYLGEIAFEWSDLDTLTVYVPADLVTRLGDALLDPAFILQALPGLLLEIENGLRDAATSGLPAAVADPLHLGADGIGVIRVGAEALADTLGPLIAALPDAGEVEGLLEDELTALFQPEGSGFVVVIDVTVWCGVDECTGANDLTEIDDVSASVTFEGEWRESTGVNLGLEGLPLSFEGGVEAYAGFSATLGMGVNLTDGPYLLLNDPAGDPEFSIEAGIEIPDDTGLDCESGLADSVAASDYEEDRCLKGKLVFLFIEALDHSEDGTGRSTLNASVGFDVTSTGPVDVAGQKVTLGKIVSGDLGIDLDIEGTIHLDFHIRTGVDIPGVTGAGDLPSLLGTFLLDWSISLADTEIPEPTIEFGNLHLDVGTFLAQFINPIASEIKKITGPLQPIIDTLMAPIPVISDLAELVGQPPVTMISLLEVATGADLSLVRSVAAFITFFNQIAGLDSTLQIPLGGFIGDDRAPGDFTVDAPAASSPVAPSQATSLISGSSASGKGSGFVADVAGDTGLPAQGNSADGRPTTFGVPGLSFPFLEDATQLFGLLVGSDITLIRWDAGTLEASAGFSYDFGPIMAGPVPITITIGGEIGVRGRFAIGYDTYGIRQLLDGGSGTALFDGIFIDDLDANGNDVPEIEFFGKVFAGAAVDLLIVSAGVRGGIELTFALDLDDRPDPDGKLRIEEIVDKLQNPICLFVVNGKIEAFLEVFVEIDLFLWSEEFSFELVRVTLLEWSSACEPPEPELGRTADADGDTVLTLNVGDLRDRRNIQEDQVHESVEVRQIGNGKVRVSGFGWEEVHSGVDLIVADAGGGNDELKFLNGTEEGTDGSDEDDLVPWDIPVVASGGPGADIIVVEGTATDGGSADKLLGDAPTGTSWLGFTFTQSPTEGGDVDDDYEGDDGDHINAGPGDDLVLAGDSDDEASGEFGADTVLGGAGNDDLDGGPGPDVVDGQGGADTVQGGPIDQPDAGASNVDIDDDDLLIGGPGRDVASGDFGNDLVFGDDPADVPATTDAGSGRLARVADIDTPFLTWCAAPGVGTDGDDILTGTDGDDYLVGGAGDDSIDGGDGDDHECGGPDEDTVIGGAGNDQLFGDGENDVLEGNDGADYIRGGAGDDLANGHAGNDDIFGDAGSDLLYGDEGDDIIVGDGGTLGTHSNGVAVGGDVATALVTALDGALTVVGAVPGATLRICPDGDSDGSPSGDSDCIYGGVGSDALFGGNDADVMRGDAGVDFLEGNAGDDNMRGGTENDVLLGSAGADTIYGDSGDDGAFGDRSISEWAANTPSTGAIDAIYGGQGADHVEGDGADDQLFGGADDDHIEGNNGQDTILGEAGDDDLIGGSDTAFGTGDSDDEGEVSVFGGTGSDVIAGDNAVIDPDGYVLGRSVELLDIGNDDVGGGDTIEGDGATDAIFGQTGNDTLSGDHGDVGPMLQSAAPDYIEGNDGNDTIHGEAGDDDLVGGGSAIDGVIDADRNGTGLDDMGETTITGGNGRDWIAGDNARFDRVLGNGEDYPSETVTPIQLFDLATTTSVATSTSYGPDTISGGDATDLIFGQGGDDVLSGDAWHDYVEGNDGDDTMSGGLGNDDLIGGGSAADGLIVELRTGAGLLDGGETSIAGGEGRDSIAGDNARMNRVLFQGPDYPDSNTDPVVLFDLQRSELLGDPTPEAVTVDGTGVFGNDTATGGDGTDLMFGQGGDDVLDGNGDADYIEGNDGNDDISGGGGDDDIVGGGSARDGVIDPVRLGEGLHDEGETLIEGNAGVDWIMGDNAFSNRVLFADDVTPIDLFDVNSADEDVSGGDLISGGTEDDVIFGQGNGAQPVEGEPGAQSDPDGDDIDNDGDGDVDEDGLHQAGWLGDTILGDEGADYIEGNHGADYILGGSGPDDIAGGGSAIDGVIDDDRIGDGLRDGRDTIWGGTEDDVVGGDNIRILDAMSDAGPLWLTNARDVLLFDVNSGDNDVSGGDFVGGEDGADVLFGQGNGVQSPEQADPLDGFDNDLDGRESVASTEYDCFDGVDNDGDGFTDVDGAGDGNPAIDADCVGAIGVGGVDEDQPWDGDIIWGGAGDDYAEGNHGADWMFGDDDQDDLIGGGSASDGHITADRDPAGLTDGHDVINGDDGLGNASPVVGGGDSDVITGDNARVNRIADTNISAWALIPNATSGYSLVDRDVHMVEDPAPPADFGADHIRGDTKHDQIYGQQGDDLLEGNHGDDAVIGDLGKFVTSVSTGPTQHISPNPPFIEDDIFANGTLYHLATLFSQETGDGSEGDDIVLGGQGHDDLHGGPGDDVMNGDLFSEFGTLPDPDLVEIEAGQFVWDDPEIGEYPFANEDAIFGGWGDDVMWGGRDPDHLYGGRGDDYIDVRPRPAGLVEGSPRDPAAWFTWVRVYDVVTDTYGEEHYQDSDAIHGGWDQDVMQSNLADPGPNDGDRLFDEVGAHNLYYICDPHYGSYTAIRNMAPSMRQFLIDLAAGDGLDDPGNAGSSGFSELALVYPKDAKNNANPPHPETPGHFYCGPLTTAENPSTPGGGNGNKKNK